MKNIPDMINGKFVFFAIEEKGVFKYFCEKKPKGPAAMLYGYKPKDFIKVEVKIKGVADLNKMNSFNGKYCGFYDKRKEDLAGAYIFNSLIQTAVCFSSYPKKEHGEFVELEVQKGDNQ